MYRNIINELAKWYESDSQVLLLKGAKGVGKTWTITDFADAFFDCALVVDFEKESDFVNLFQGSVDADKIENKLRRRFRQTKKDGRSKMLSFDEHLLLVFDEVQFIKDPIPGIMAYAMQRPGVRICMVASWMGPLEGENFYEDLSCLFMYPMTFEEYLTAHKAHYLCEHIERQKMEPLDPQRKEEAKQYLEEFMRTGGMPEVVYDNVKYKSFDHTDAILTRILSEERAFIRLMAPRSMHRRVLKIWDSLPEQLQKPNRKFMYGCVDEKARAREYESAVTWLVDSGLVRYIPRVKDALYPLQEHVDKKSFELYHLDHGLLRVMCGCMLETVDSGQGIYDVLGGILTEQYAIAELTQNKIVNKLYFWVSGATAKVDLVFEDAKGCIPVDIQSKVRGKAQSLRVFYKKYSNSMSIRLSLADLSIADGLLNIPLYGLWNF